MFLEDLRNLLEKYRAIIETLEKYNSEKDKLSQIHIR